jgi:hypothetical protein
MGAACGGALSRSGTWWPMAHSGSHEKGVVPRLNPRHIISVLTLLVIEFSCTYA